MPLHRFSSSVFFALFVTLALLGTSCTQPREAPAVMVFGASSLRDALQEVAMEFKKTSGAELHFNFAGSNDLARQIAAGAQADILVSADLEWMQFVRDKGKIVPGTETALLANHLVIVAHKSSSLAVSSPQDLADLPYRYLALGDPTAVPAGKYAKKYLEGHRIGDASVWSRVSDRVAPAVDVRFALNLVESDASVVGIVYRSDAAASNQVRILYEVPEADAPVRYFATRIKRDTASPNAEAFYRYLGSMAAGDVFRRHGLAPLREVGATDE